MHKTGQTTYNYGMPWAARASCLACRSGVLLACVVGLMFSLVSSMIKACGLTVRVRACMVLPELQSLRKYSNVGVWSCNLAT